MALINPNDFWLFRLSLILLGYASVLVPGYIFVRFIKQRWKENDSYFQKNRFLNFIRRFAIGQPEYELVVMDFKDPARVHTADQSRQSIHSSFRKCGLLVAYSIGIQITLVSMGFLQERIMTLDYSRLKNPTIRDKFGDAQFLVFANRVIALTLVAFYLIFQWKKMPPHVPPLYTHSFISISNTISSWCQYEALKFVSFPTQTVCKAAKVVPTMLMGRILRNERRPTFDYLMGICLAFGTTLFLLSSQFSSQKDGFKHTVQLDGTLSGIILMASYLLFDAFTLNWQKKLFDTKPTISRYQMIFGVNGFSAILCLVSLLEQGTLFTSLSFLTNHSGFALDVFLLSFCNATGQLFIYVTIEQFGPVVFAIVMTIRQIFSIILSTIYFSHPVSFVGVIGLVLAFGSLIVNSYFKCVRM